MKVKAIECFRYEGEHVEAGETIEVHIDDAKKLFQIGRAEAVSDDESADAAPAPEAVGYTSMKKDELLTLALARQLPVDVSFTKAKIIEALETNTVLTTVEGAAAIEGAAVQE